MRRGRRLGFTAEQNVDIWRRWKAGDSLHEIGRAFGNDHDSIQFLLSQHGGIVPAVRWRSLRSLTLAEREDISGALLPAHRFVRSAEDRSGLLRR